MAGLPTPEIIQLLRQRFLPSHGQNGSLIRHAWTQTETLWRKKPLCRFKTTRGPISTQRRLGKLNSNLPGSSQDILSSSLCLDCRVKVIWVLPWMTKQSIGRQRKTSDLIGGFTTTRLTPGCLLEPIHWNFNCSIRRTQRHSYVVWKWKSMEMKTSKIAPSFLIATRLILVRFKLETGFYGLYPT